MGRGTDADRIPGENERRCPCCPSIYPVGSTEWVVLRQRVNGKQVACRACRDAREPQWSDFNVSRNFRKAGPSHQAAQKAEQSAKLNDTHRKIYRALREKPMTADDVAASLGLVLNTARARISDLTNAGWIYDTGERGETAAGKPATVWAITQQQGEAA